MPRPESPPTSMADVQAAAVTLERALRRLHLSATDRRSIIEAVRGDLEAAAADGIDPQSLIGPDPDAFARQAATAGGYQQRPGHYARLLLAGAGGALVALVVGYLLIVYAIYPAATAVFDVGGFHPVLGAYVSMSAIALVVALGIVGALALALRGRAAARATLTRAAMLVAAVAAAGVVLVGRAAMDSTTTTYLQTLGQRGVLVAALLAAALLTARTWALHSPVAQVPPAR